MAKRQRRRCSWCESDLDGGLRWPGWAQWAANNNVTEARARPDAGSARTLLFLSGPPPLLPVRDIRCESDLLSRPQRFFVSSGNDKFACKESSL